MHFPFFGHIYRILFRPKARFKEKEGVNVVDSIVRARVLYRQLIVLTHPDRNPNNVELATKLSSEITKNKFNYAELLIIKDRVQKELLNCDNDAK